mmetsp:Transcript_26638/g.50199  ORF Transcript_26638/g.50199 Transcript_26638/m.50199 type:complete len:274 (+) Transcript_26638:98-919(+)
MASFSARTLTQKLLLPVSSGICTSVGADKASKVSPFSRARRTLPLSKPALSMSSVPLTHVYKGVHIARLLSASTQPSQPVEMQRLLVRRAPSFFTIFGPSKTWKVSPTSNVLITLLPDSNLLCSVSLAVHCLKEPPSSMYEVPWLPFIVAQPSLPSLCILTRTLHSLRSLSSMGSSSCSIISLRSIFRRALHSLTLKPSVRAVCNLQTRTRQGSSRSWPCASTAVIQPLFPSLRAFPRRRETSTAGSLLGPSRTSKMAPARARPASLLELLQA